MEEIYEECSGSYDDAPDEVRVTVLVKMPGDAPSTPRYLVVLQSFQEGERTVPRTDSADFQAIRWAQAEYDALKARVEASLLLPLPL